jgi:hypothetical protein
VACVHRSRFERQGYVIGYRAPVQKPGSLKYEPDFRFALDVNVSGRLPIETRDKVEDGGFPAARRPENGIEASTRNFKTDVVKDTQPRPSRNCKFLGNFLKGNAGHERVRYFSSTMMARPIPLMSSSCAFDCAR